MRYVFAFVALELALAAPAGAQPAGSQREGVLMVNGTGAPLSALVIRSYNREPWRPIGAGSAAPGQRSPVATTPGECAYDVRAALPGGKLVTWSGVNLCDTRTVTLNRRRDGATWVDYD
jgi:hypothetical protein